MAWRLVKLGLGRASIRVKPQQCSHGSKAHGTQCDEMRRPEPGATRCIQHRYEETMGCRGHDDPNCKQCPRKPKAISGY